MDDPYDLDRFIEAQDRPGHQDNYQAAVKELHAGRKQSCWMWWVFPQLLEAAGDDAYISETTRKYAIRSREEAAAYLAHEVLGPRLHRCAHLAATSGAVNANTLMGGYPDDLKLQSSMTLFAEVAREDGNDTDFVAALDELFKGRRDPKTLTHLRPAVKATTASPPEPSFRTKRRSFRRSAAGRADRRRARHDRRNGCIEGNRKTARGGSH